MIRQYNHIVPSNATTKDYEMIQAQISLSFMKWARPIAKS